MAERMRIAIGPTRYLDCDHVVRVDARHPISHGGFQIDAVVTDGIIVEAEPRIGFLHRSAEKLFESRDYRQIMMLANRHDWHSSFHGELVIAKAVEDALGITPPECAVVTRTLLAEVNRINVCLLFLGCALPAEQGAHLLDQRESLLGWYQGVSGSRIHPMINRIGGLAHRVPELAVNELTKLIDALDLLLPQLRKDIEGATDSYRDLARITAAHVQQFGLSGPIAKASGFDVDLRRTDPAYANVVLPQTTELDGTLRARYAVLSDEIETSITIVRSTSEQLHACGDAPIDVPLPKVVRVPEGMTYSWVEGPLGRTGALVVSAGDKMPWRLKLVTPSFHTMQSLGEVLPGLPLDHLGEALSSIFMVIGDVDR